MEKINELVNSSSRFLLVGSTKAKYFLLSIVIVGLFLLAPNVILQAQENSTAPVVDYQGQPPVDSDLDGLTDAAEIQIYDTDPKNVDSDGDSWYDGIEIINSTDPSDVQSFPGIVPDVTRVQPADNEIPWAWYTSRASAFVAFILLYLSIFLGLTLRISWLRKIFSPVYALDTHCWISLYATIFAFIHGGVLLLDKFLKLTVADLFIPFVSKFETNLMAVGIIGFYLMIILVATSYGKKYMSHKLWRAVHFLNIILYVVVVIHAYYLGTDMKNDAIRNIFIYSNTFLILLMSVNMFLRIRDKIVLKNTGSFDNDQN